MKIKNPIVEKCCADPEARIYGGKYYIYVTKGNVTVYSSSDLENWTEHENILAIEEFPHVHKCIWAPTIIDKDGKYYLFFASNYYSKYLLKHIRRKWVYFKACIFI